eukprot:TRINITY_DN5886_c0_g1_i1.p2 TRINITY_DN5886_c0_g1~~TRINITY_DN5886_c0_g1_i1.p2  ORF type:complete len:104 (+),score=12.91 TRINITY_DN5886_c0_g1_i1:101-412(+)
MLAGSRNNRRKGQRRGTQEERRTIHKKRDHRSKIKRSKKGGRQNAQREKRRNRQGTPEVRRRNRGDGRPSVKAKRQRANAVEDQRRTTIHKTHEKNRGTVSSH